MVAKINPAGLADKFVTVAGLKIRYLKHGDGPAVVLLHGASLGSSSDVWCRNMAPLAGYGLRVIAYDQPGFGLSDDPPDWSVALRTSFILDFMNALSVERAALVGHSQAGAMAVTLALSHAERVHRLVVLGTGSLLPPLEGQPGRSAGPAEGHEGSETEPTLADVRAALEANLYDHSLITAEELAIRHRMSVGKNIRAFRARNAVGTEKRDEGEKPKPLWQRLAEVRPPLLMIYGREDRGQAARRAALAKEQNPGLNLHIADNCKHLVQWDAAEEFHRLAGPFLRS